VTQDLLAEGGGTALASIGLLGLCIVHTLGEDGSVLILRSFVSDKYTR
jgi:hypothetical protein